MQLRPWLTAHGFTAVAVALAGLSACSSSPPPRANKDAGLDAPREHMPDGGRDAGGEAGLDAGADARPDAGADAAPGPFAGYAWTTLPAPAEAFVTTLALDSQGTLYAGAEGEDRSAGAGAGIFRSTDDGTSWQPASVGLTEYTITALAAAGTTLYAGAFNLQRSTDRGASWQLTGAPLISGEFQNLAVQGQLVVAGDGGGNPLYVSTDAGHTFNALDSPGQGLTRLEVLAGGTVILWAGATGVYRSTDRGASFHPVAGIATGPSLTARLRCDGASTCYVVAFTTPDSSAQAVLLKSTDAGATWTPLSQFAVDVLALSDTGRLYVAVPPMVERSDDGGSTFTPIACPTAADGSTPDCFGTNQTFGPFVARGDELLAASRTGVYRSHDEGQTWQLASGSVASGAITGPIQRIFVDASPKALGPNGDLYVLSVGGLDVVSAAVYSLKRSSDDGRSWQTVASPFASGPCIATPAGALMCDGVSIGTQELMLFARSDDHGATWRAADVPPGLGETNGSAVLSTDGSMVYVAGPSGIGRSTDDGLTFHLVPGGPALGSLQALRSGHLLANQELGSGGYRSDDQGATWQPLDALPPLPVVEDAGGRLFHATGAGIIQVSADEGATWTALPSGGLPASLTEPVPLAVDGAGHLFVFVAASAGKPNGVFASADGGALFMPMPAQIPNPNALSLAADKQGRLLVGTTGGLFRLEAP